MGFTVWIGHLIILKAFAQHYNTELDTLPFPYYILLVVVIYVSCYVNMRVWELQAIDMYYTDMCSREKTHIDYNVCVCLYYNNNMCECLCTCTKLHESVVCLHICSLMHAWSEYYISIALLWSMKLSCISVGLGISLILVRSWLNLTIHFMFNIVICPWFWFGTCDNFCGHGECVLLLTPWSLMYRLLYRLWWDFLSTRSFAFISIVYRFRCWGLSV